MSGGRDDYDALLSQMKIAARLRMEIAKIYADVDALICRTSVAMELGRDSVLYALRDVNRLRLEVFEKVLGEMREERQRREAIETATEAERDPARRLN